MVSLATLESMSKLETEKIYLQVTALLNEKSATDRENELLLDQQRLNLMHIESLNLQMKELGIENDELRKERLTQETGNDLLEIRIMKGFLNLCVLGLKPSISTLVRTRN